MPSLFQTLVLLIIAAACYGLLKMLNERSLKIFRYDFFGKGISITCVLATSLYFCGDFSRKVAIATGKTGADGMPGLTLMGIAVVIVIGMIIHNIVKTNFIYGICGSVLQIIALPALAAWEVVAFGLKLLWVAFCDSSNSKPTYEHDDGYQKHQDMLQQDTQKTSSSYRFKNDKDSLY